jgi:outer membrane protein TolC
VQTLRKIKCFAFLALNLFLLNNAGAQEVYDLSRCIKTGLEQNFSLQVVRNNEQIATNNFTRGNAGMLPKVTANSRYGGSVNSSNQNFTDGSELTTQGTHNTYGSAGIDLGMTIFKGFEVQQTYKKLGEQNELSVLNTQMNVENLVAKIVAEYSFYVQQLIQFENLAYAVSLSRERVRIDEQRYLLGGASKMELLQSLVYLNADSSNYSRQNTVLNSSQIRLNELMASENVAEIIVLKDTLLPINENLQCD